MPTIHPLSSELIASIAAGEVIERPKYAVKELIDNAIDAKAHRILIDIRDGGLSLIAVEDDGIGMSPEDLMESFKLHTTSKIGNLDDLQRIHTLGFRGEALASIAATSVLTIQSRREKDPLGLEVKLVNQKIVSKRQIGMPTGTRVVIEDFFESVPARKKFLKSEATEFRHILETVEDFVVSQPTIHFILKHNKKIILDIPSAKDTAKRLAVFLDEDEFERMIPIDITDSYVTVRGFFAHPSQARKNPFHQYSIINERRIVSPLVGEAFREAVRELLPSDSYLPFFFYITVPPELVDVNIHPRKELVAFTSPPTVYAAIQQAVQTALQKYDLTFQTSFLHSQTQGPITDTDAGRLLKDIVLEKSISPSFSASPTQYHLTYIIVQTENGILLVDQHAAHERILYEKFVEAYKNERQKNQTMTVHIPTHFSSSDKLLLSEYQNELKELGFVFNSKFSFIEVPKILADRDVIDIIEELIADLRKGLPLRHLDYLTHKLLTYLACRSAVKAGDKLHPKEMMTILQDLQNTANKYTCPHGRPTMIEVPLTNLHKLFKRI